MTGKERMACAMRLGVPDRVPVMCQLALGYYFLKSSQDAFDIWYTSEGFAEALCELAGRYGFDGVLVNLPGRDPHVGRFITKIVREKGRRIIHFTNGGYAVLPDDDNARYVPPESERHHVQFAALDPEKLYYVEPWDTTGVSYPYRWGFEKEARQGKDFFPPYHTRTLREVKARAGSRFSVHGEVFSPFSQFLELVGLREGLLATVEDPSKVEACLERLTKGACDQGLRFAQCGIDALLVSSAYAGGAFISRQQYSRFVLPYERKLIHAVKRQFDIAVYTHTCGAIGDRLELMLCTGTDGIDTLDPPPLGNVQFEDAWRRLQGKAFCKGNIDPVNTLLRGSVSDVRREARRRIELAGPSGGYILSSACSVPPHTPEQNVACLREVADEGFSPGSEPAQQ